MTSSAEQFSEFRLDDVSSAHSLLREFSLLEKTWTRGRELASGLSERPRKFDVPLCAISMLAVQRMASYIESVFVQNWHQMNVIQDSFAAGHWQVEVPPSKKKLGDTEYNHY